MKSLPNRLGFIGLDVIIFAGVLIGSIVIGVTTVQNRNSVADTRSQAACASNEIFCGGCINGCRRNTQTCNRWIDQECNTSTECAGNGVSYGNRECCPGLIKCTKNGRCGTTCEAPSTPIPTQVTSAPSRAPTQSRQPTAIPTRVSDRCPNTYQCMTFDDISAFGLQVYTANNPCPSGQRCARARVVASPTPTRVSGSCPNTYQCMTFDDISAFGLQVYTANNPCPSGQRCARARVVASPTPTRVSGSCPNTYQCMTFDDISALGLQVYTVNNPCPSGQRCARARVAASPTPPSRDNSSQNTRYQMEIECARLGQCVSISEPPRCIPIGGRDLMFGVNVECYAREKLRLWEPVRERVRPTEPPVIIQSPIATPIPTSTIIVVVPRNTSTPTASTTRAPDVPRSTSAPIRTPRNTSTPTPSPTITPVIILRPSFTNTPSPGSVDPAALGNITCSDNSIAQVCNGKTSGILFEFAPDRCARCILGPNNNCTVDTYPRSTAECANLLNQLDREAQQNQNNTFNTPEESIQNQPSQSNTPNVLVLQVQDVIQRVSSFVTTMIQTFNLPQSNETQTREDSGSQIPQQSQRSAMRPQQASVLQQRSRNNSISFAALKVEDGMNIETVEQEQTPINLYQECSDDSDCLAIVNGDFFEADGRLNGPSFVNGEWNIRQVNQAQSHTLVVDNQGKADIVNYCEARNSSSCVVNGYLQPNRQPTALTSIPNVTTAFSGYPLILEDGVYVGCALIQGSCSQFSNEITQRTIAATTQSGNVVMLNYYGNLTNHAIDVINTYNNGHSNNPIVSALNLDGGTSSQLLYRDQDGLNTSLDQVQRGVHQVIKITN